VVGKTREIAGGIEFKETLTNTELASGIISRPLVVA